jgi:hypothetical protein
VDWLQIISNIVLALTLVAVAWQAREAARQSRVSSTVAGISALREAMRHLHDVLSPWLDRPHVRSYFDEPRPWPADSEERARLRTLAEMWADCVGTTLNASEAVEAFLPFRAAWESYASSVLQNSIVVYTVITENPDWCRPLLISRA